jgi:CelD/BcsL family acetyltransferase involved in cellulose biosynthesis
VSRSHAGWTVRLEPFTPTEQLQAAWTDLQSRSECSYFQSWGWVSAWAAGIEPGRLEVLRVDFEERPVALALLGHRLLRRHKIVPSRALLLFESGIAASDAVTMEHNGWLIERGREPEALAHALSGLRKARRGWDEILISAMDEQPARVLSQAAQAAGLHLVSRYSKPTFCVSLDRLRARGGDAFADFSSNTRQQIRRAIRGYEARGPLTITEAATLEQARAFFAELRDLHTAHWNAKGLPGAFAPPFAAAFHERLIGSRFAHGEIQLLRICAGDRLLGLLYNFVLGGVVYNYQTAFAYDDDPKLKPGLVCHAQAIVHLLTRGARTYDLLMGEQRYKKSLAHEESRMLWLAVHRHRLRLALDRAAGAVPLT